MKDSAVGNQGIEAMADGQRREHRDSLLVLARLGREGAATETVRVRNVSSGGLMAQASADYRPGMRVEIELEGLGRLSGTVAWSEAGRIGISFDHPVEKELARKAKAKPGDDLFRPAVARDSRRPPIRSH